MSRPQILVAVDASDAAVAAVRVSGAIASALDARIVVLHVHEPGRNGPYDEAPETRAVRVLAERGLVAHIHARSGEASSEILAAATTLKPDLLVMGSRGRSTMSGMLVGSVSRPVLANATCPVLLVRASTAMIHAPYTILLAVERGSGLEPLLRVTARLAKALPARVIAIHVSYPGGEDVERDLDATRTHGEEALSSAASMLAAVGVTVETESLTSTAELSHAIARHADQVRADLIVLGRHRPAGSLEPAPAGKAGLVSRLSSRPVLVTSEHGRAR
jgi:nucleotide-binding universal stress UspA family protein